MTRFFCISHQEDCKRKVVSIFLLGICGNKRSADCERGLRSCGHASVMDADDFEGLLFH